MTTPSFRIGARGSPLSTAQTRRVIALLARSMAVPDAEIEFVPITTSGDTIQDRRLIEAGGKGLFTKELDEALLNGRIDMAVHSLKDLPTQLPGCIALACVPEREDPRDAFVCTRAATLDELPAGANVGTASLRRQAQTLFARPDLGVVTLRGNVETRLRKLDAGEADATFLALAGLKRLGLERHAASLIDPHDMPPAACQGALAITARSDDARMRDALDRLEDRSARIEIEAERAFLDALDGSCRTPIGALARVRQGRLEFIGETLTPDGAARWRKDETNTIGSDDNADARALGARLGHAIRDDAGSALISDRE